MKYLSKQILNIYVRYKLGLCCKMSTNINNATDFKLVEAVSSSLSASSGFNKSSFNNCIFPESDGVNGSAEKTMSVIEKILDVVANWIDCSGKAKADVKNSEERIDAGRKLSEKEQKNADTSIKEILSDINCNVDSINSAIEKINKLAGDSDGGLKELENQLQEKKMEICDAIEVLRNPSSNEDEKNQALETIKACNSFIANLLVKVNDIQDQICCETENVQSYTDQITEKQDAAEDIIANTFEIISGISVKTGAEGATNTAYVAEGGTEVAEGEAVIAEAAVTEVTSLGTGTAVAAEATEKALDHIEGGYTHIKDGGKNLTKLGSALDKINIDMSTVQNYANVVGDVLTLAEGSIGSYQSISTDMITSIGSWSTVESANNYLGIAVNEYEGKNEQKQENKDLLLEFDVNQFDLQVS